MCFIIPGENVAFIFSELPLFLSIGDTTDCGVKCRWLILRWLCTVVLFQVSEKKAAVCKLIQIHKQQDGARESLLSSLASLYCQNRIFLMSDIKKLK